MNFSSPKISVIVPVYNVEKYLNKCIESILNQEFVDFELLLINDGSKDNSGKICDQYALHDSRIQVFHTSNKGVSFARNLGLKSAKGKYINFIDADDWIENNTFLTISEFIQTNDIDIIQFGYKKIYPTFDEDYNQKYSLFFDSLTKYADSNCFQYTVSTYFIKRNIIQDNRIQFSEGIKYAEDQEFIIKCLSFSNSIQILPDLFYNYRIRENSAMTNKSNLNRATDHISVTQNLLNYQNQIPEKALLFFNKYTRQVLKAFFFILISFTKNYKDLKKAQNIYNTFYDNNPKSSILNTPLFRINRITIILYLFYIKIRSGIQ